MTSKHLEYASELQDKLDKDLSWRRKEIIDLALLVDTKNGEIKITLIRSAIALLYAHWEGFIKNASIHYLEYICKLKLRLAFLTENFCHISLGKKFSKTTSVHSYESQKALFDYIFYDHENTEFMVVPKSTLTVDGNLKFEVFKVITKQIGVDVSHYETKEKLINSILLRCQRQLKIDHFT